MQHRPVHLASGVVVLALLALSAVGGTPPGALAADGAPVTPANATSALPSTSIGPSDQAPAGDPAASVDPFRAREDRLALLLGRARVSAGLLPLARSPALDRAAQAHAQDMVARGYMEHQALDGSTPSTRAAQEGYATPAGGAWLVVETISALGDEPERALGWWLSDGLHRRVVLRSNWREVGLGFAPGGPYGRFWVALFGCRPNVLPPVLLDGMLAIPDETCGRGAEAFGPVQAVRVAEASTTLQSQDWEPYAAQRNWPTGRTAVVALRDATGREIEVGAMDPTGAPTLGL